MSADETAGEEKAHPPVYDIVEARWQSLELKTFLRALDRMYREDWASPIGERASSGSAPRVRRESLDPRVEDGIAPIGLWRNCYDAEWLASLQPHEIEHLDILDKDYDFSLRPIPVDKKGKGRAL